MTFLAPVFFYLGLGAAAGALALHFIVTRQPTSSPLPTVRFIPVSAVRVTTVAPMPEDLLVLLVRMLLAIAIGAALARPVLTPHRRPVARVVMADVSSAIGDIVELRDSTHALLGAGDVLIAFDSTAHALRKGASDSASHLVRTGRAGRLSPALVVALREGAAIRDQGDSIELAIVSPLRAREIDGATQAIRALWPGRIRIVHVRSAPDSVAQRGAMAISGATEDPLADAASAAGIGTSDTAVRIVRGSYAAADSVWAASARHTLVRWPVAETPRGFVARAKLDTAGAVIAGEAALVYPLERRFELDTAVRATRIAARWVDGHPAAIERGVGAGCIRDVAIPVPAHGDLVLRPAFGRLLRALSAPCEMIAGGPALDEARARELAGGGSLATARDVRAPDTIVTPLVPWLLAAALVLAILELLVRRGSSPLWSAEASDAPATSARKPGAAA